MNQIIDFCSDEVLLDPYPAYRQLLDSGGVMYDETKKIVYLGRYDDVRELLKNADQFSSSHSAMTETMVHMDGDSHFNARDILQAAFQPAVLARELTRLNDLTDKRAHNLSVLREPFDFVDMFAARIPTTILSWMFGEQDDRSVDYRAWSWAFLNSGAEHDGQHTLTHEQLLADSKRYLDELFQEALSKPSRGWVVQILIKAYREERITYQGMMNLGILLMAAAHETTSDALTNSMLVLADRQHMWATLRHDEVHVKPFVEEVLRFEPPVQRRPRFAVEDVSIGGIEVPASTNIVAMIGAANRDPDVFEEPDTFLLNRKRNPHLSFGSGPHVCLGMQLARIEMINSINALRRHIRSFRLSRPLTADDYRNVLFLRSPKQLWLEFTH
jgi:cytochrome P450